MVKVMSFMDLIGMQSERDRKVYAQMKVYAQVANTVFMQSVQGRMGDFVADSEYLRSLYESQSKQKFICYSEDESRYMKLTAKLTDMFKGMTDEYKEKLALLDASVCLAIDSVSRKVSYVTRDFGVLRNICKHVEAMSANTSKAVDAGALEDKLIKSLMSEARLSKMFEEGKMGVVRLDIDYYEGDNVVFKPMVPRSRIDIDLGQEGVTFLVPLLAIMSVSDCMRNLLNQGVYSVKWDGANDVEKQHYVTTSKSDIATLYGNDADVVMAREQIAQFVGFNYASKRFVAYNAEAPKTELGLLSFPLHELNFVGSESGAPNTPCNVKAIDAMYHELNPEVVFMTFNAAVRRMKNEELDKVSIIPGISTMGTREDKKAALLEWSNNSANYRVLYNYLMLNPWIVKGKTGTMQDVTDRLEKRKQMLPKCLKVQDKVSDVPSRINDANSVMSPNRADMLKAARSEVYKLANEGVVCGVYIQKSGDLKQLVGTMNKGILSKMLGKDYLVENGSLKSRVDSFLVDIATEGLNAESAYDLYNKWGLTKVAPIDQDAYNKCANLEEQIDMLKIGAGEAKATAVAYSEGRNDSHLVYLCNPFSTGTEDFTRALNLKTLVLLRSSEHVPTLSTLRKGQ